jgi:hypothetical protein
LPSRMIGAENSPFFWRSRDRDSAHRDVEIVGFEVPGQLRPGGLDVFDLDAERLAQCLCHVDVKAPIFRRRFIKKTKGQIIAGHSDAQRSALQDLVEPGGWLSLRRSRNQDKRGNQAGENAQHRASGRCYISLSSLRTKFAAAARPAISVFRRSNRCRASLSRSSTNLTASSPDIGPLVIGWELSPMVSSTK